MVALAPAVSRRPFVGPSAWFWVTVLLCTPVAVLLADWVALDQGVGLIPTALLFAGVLVGGVVAQVRSAAAAQVLFWPLVGVASVTGVLLTDVFTDVLLVPLAGSVAILGTAFATALLAWSRRNPGRSVRTLVSAPRDASCWTVVVLAFALGTAIGDLLLDATGDGKGWTPGQLALVPLAVLAVTLVGWRAGVAPVAVFWVAFVAARPLGAYLGDLLVVGPDRGGLGLGKGVTGFLLFGLAVAAAVVPGRLARGTAGPVAGGRPG